jgi:hypothetical protein
MIIEIVCSLWDLLMAIFDAHRLGTSDRSLKELKPMIGYKYTRIVYNVTCT